MSGVRTGTRLDHLQRLARAVDLQRTLARRAGDHHEDSRLADLAARVATAIRAEQAAQNVRPEVAAAVRRADDAVTHHLARLGVTARQVKQWAVEQGLLDAVHRGRVKGALVDAYELHQLEQAGYVRRTQETA